MVILALVVPESVILQPSGLAGSVPLSAAHCIVKIDAMTLWVQGFKNVTTSYGVHGFTDELRAFITANVETVFIAYDRDEAGDKAAHSLVEKLASDGVQAARLMLPPGLDINEWALQEKDFAGVFNECLLNARAALASAVPVTVQQDQEGKTEKKTGAISFMRDGDDLHAELGSRTR